MSDNVTGAANQQGSSLLYDLVQHSPSETIRRIPQMDDHLATLLGLLYTDGCVSRKGKNGWRIYFATKSKKLVDVFEESMINVFGLSSQRVRRGFTKDALNRAIVDSSTIGNYLSKAFGTFRTLRYSGGIYPPARVPTEQLHGCTPEFLRAAFSCDGGVSLYSAKKEWKTRTSVWLIRTIFLSCAHPTLRKNYIELLSWMGITAREVAKDGKIKIESEHEIRRFYQHIGFIPDVEVTNHSRYWRGYSKQEVLELLIQSYGNPSKVYTRENFI